MTILVTVQAQLITGEAQIIKSQAPEGMLAAVFEDDGQTGYFYALDESVEGNPIQDAVHIYNVEDISDGHIPSDVKIGWSEVRAPYQRISAWSIRFRGEKWVLQKRISSSNKQGMVCARP